MFPNSQSNSKGRSIAIGIVTIGLVIVVAVVIAAIINNDLDPHDGGSTPAKSALQWQNPVTTEDVAQVPLPTKVSWKDMDDPSADGWTSEVRADQAKKSLYQLSKYVFGQSAMDAKLADKFCAEDFTGMELIPQQLQIDFNDEKLTLKRWKAKDSIPTHRGKSGFESMVRESSSKWTDVQDVRFEIKVVRSIEKANHLETRQLISVAGNRDGYAVEQHATWETNWKTGSNSKALILQSIRVVDFEQTERHSNVPLFSDCAPSILRGNEIYESQLLHGVNHWLERIQDMRYFAPLGSPGLAVADVNNDGLDDLYLCQEANLPNRLFLQQADGTAVEVSAEWNVDFLQGSRGVLLVDLDNDGDQDLAVAIMGGLVLASNEGNRFEIRDCLTTDDDTTSLSAADFDLDGDLDLYVCVDYPNDEVSSLDDTEGGIKVQGGAANRVYHDANDAGRNSLFRNDITQNGEWKFPNVTDEAGIENNERFSWASCWEDYDNDGDQDLYVANDFGRNNLYRNDGGTFVDVANALDIEDRAASMSVSWGDVNRDGNMDLYVANMFSSAGSRVTEQPEFKQEMKPGMKNRWRRFAMGNSLFSNQGRLGFANISQRAAITMGRWSWSSNFLDINNDGWEDIVVANGYITSANDKSDL